MPHALPFSSLPLFAALCSSRPVLATPLLRSSFRPVPRDNTSGSNVVRIVVPIVVVVGLVALVLLARYRKIVFGKFGLAFNNRVHTPAAQPNAEPRELTAAEITGTAPVAPATRRPRRNRRTPSQMSTRSLPAYAKEPGELELVIIQGSADLEDTPAPTHVVMPSLPERDSDSTQSQHGRQASNASSYVHVGDADDEPHVSTPLLSEEENDDSNEPSHANRATIAVTAAAAGNAADESSAALLSAVSPATPNASHPDPRGEAPPYFEAVDSATGLARMDTRDTLPIAPIQTRSSEQGPESSLAFPPPETSSTAQEAPRRRSVFRGIMQAFNPRPRQDAEAQHSRANPDTPTIPEGVPSSSEAQPRQSSRFSIRPVSTHRPSQSAGSGSVFSLSSSGFHRTTSRVSTGAGALTSSSALSVNSISAPLTHTATRTDFVYPRSGPTPEQLKLISSREAFGKFGVPYGPDAIAFHASTSLVNLHGPPPEFEENPSIDGLPASSPHPGSSGLPVPSTSSPSPSHGRTRSALSQTHSAESSGDSLPEAEEQAPVEQALEPALSRVAASPGTLADTSADTSLQLSQEASLTFDAPTLTPDTSVASAADASVDRKDEHDETESVSELGTLGGHSRDGTITRASTITIKPDATVPRASVRASIATVRPDIDAEPLVPPSPVASTSSANYTTTPVAALSSSLPSSTGRIPPALVTAPSVSLPSAAGHRPSPLTLKKSQPGLSAAPTSFKMPTSAGGARPPSRADSVTSVGTFATADTHFTDARTASPGLETETEDEAAMVSAPGTPRIDEFGAY
ncbi:hypothetical protein K488DRAFT_81589 [Vararia minispora EC-137]|uniref:Uncharacterized protein n=1 Tax=Vararia minispora EC-137 TaxID=1314806 RepID=A0ACB8QZ09_9AGAM|nr:hypothetical protein K488DRAFT_81589 [Vararia minispora EC-137]